MSIRVLLADDQPLLRTGFRLILEAEPDLAVVGEAGDGARSVELTRILQPDVVLMDIRMPGTDGIQATRQIISTGPSHPRSITAPRVLILTTFDLDEYIVDALRAGASGFLLKDVPPDDLVSAIRVVAAGEAIVSPAITRKLLDWFATGRSPARRTASGPREGTTDGLTGRESEVFRLLARGLSNAEIAAALVVSDTTVKTHVGSVLAKLGLRDRVQAVIYAYEAGIIQPGEDHAQA